MTGRRAVMLGIDGLSWEFVRAPVVASSMPNLTAFLAQAEAGPLRSTTPPYTAPGWTTITTGVDPGRHGVFGFTDRAGRPVGDPNVAVPRAWDYVGAAGGRSIVVNVPLTYPPRPIEGLIVTGMPVPPGRPFAHPEDLGDRLVSDHGYVVDVPGVEAGATFDRLTAMTAARGRATVELATSEPWDLLAVVFVLPDRLGHPWWKQLVPGTDLYDTRAAARIRDLARAPLAALDRAIGDILGALPAGTPVVLCSDHGFGPLTAEVFFDVVLAQEGLMEMPRGRLLTKIVGRLGKSGLRRLLPYSLRTRLKAGLAATNRSARRAWTAPVFERGVRLGDPGDEALRKRVTELIEALSDPEGKPLVRAVRAREEVWDGERLDDAPDLIPEMVSEDIDFHDGLHTDTAFVSRAHLPRGTHAYEGVLAVSGAGALVGGSARLADVTATLLALLGLEAADLDGRTLVAPEGESVAVAAASRAEAGEAYAPEEEAAVMEHLRDLGYVD